MRNGAVGYAISFSRTFRKLFFFSAKFSDKLRSRSRKVALLRQKREVGVMKDGNINFKNSE